MSIFVGTCGIIYLSVTLFIVWFIDKNKNEIDKDDKDFNSGALNLIALFWIVWVIPFIIFFIKARKEHKK